MGSSTRTRLTDHPPTLLRPLGGRLGPRAGSLLNPDVFSAWASAPPPASARGQTHFARRRSASIYLYGWRPPRKWSCSITTGRWKSAQFELPDRPPWAAHHHDDFRPEVVPGRETKLQFARTAKCGAWGASCCRTSPASWTTLRSSKRSIRRRSITIRRSLTFSRLPATRPPCIGSWLSYGSAQEPQPAAFM